jgi:Flp pilus assembly protein TadD
MPNRPRRAALGAAMLSAALLAGCAQDPVAASAPGAMGAERESAAMMRLARASMDSGAYASAAGFYRRAHDMDRYDFAPLLGLGHALARTGALEEAAAALREALAMMPGDPDAHRLLGEVLIALNRPGLAVAQLQASLATRPDGRTYNGLGVAHDMMGDYDAAEKAYRDGLARDPANAALNNNLALSLAVSGHYDEAIRVLAPIAFGPLATVRQRQNLALIYGLAGERDRAARLAGQDLDPSAVRHNLAFYERLRALHDRDAIADALGLRRLGPASDISAR